MAESKQMDESDAKVQSAIIPEIVYMVVGDKNDKKGRAVLEVAIFNKDFLNNTKTPLLFIHGYLDSRLSFQSTIDYILKNNTSFNRCIIAPSLRGFGNSQIFTEGILNQFSVSSFCEDCLFILDSLKIKKAIWIGHSLGSFIAHYASVKHSNYIEKSVLIGTAFKAPKGLIEDKDCIDNILNATSVSRKFIREFQDTHNLVKNNLISQQVADQVLMESFKVSLEPYIGAWKAVINLQIMYENEDKLLFKVIDNEKYYDVKVATLILFGENDEVVPEECCQEFISKMSNKQLLIKLDDNNNNGYVTVKGANHNIQWIKPDVVAQCILKIL